MSLSPISHQAVRQDVHGVLLLDKPLGMSSNDALIRAKRLLAAKKAGHTGTLDPLATGLLPLCFGEATKFSQDLLDADKEYVADIMLGVTTCSGDAEGAVLTTTAVNVTAEEIVNVTQRFKGQIEQIPPMYSALKRDGRPLYEYARAGQTVERLARQVWIHQLEVLKVTLPYVSVRVACSKGTYIRTLAEDIGAALGCGAHLTALRRTRVGDLRIEQAVTLGAMEAESEVRQRRALLSPVDALLKNLPVVQLSPVLAARFQQGQRLPVHALSLSVQSADGRVSVYDETNRLLGIADIRQGTLHPARLVALT